jgi:hypothetical protein
MVGKNQIEIRYDFKNQFQYRNWNLFKIGFSVLLFVELEPRFMKKKIRKKTRLELVLIGRELAILAQVTRNRMFFEEPNPEPDSLFIRVIRKVTLYLGLLSPPIASFSEFHKL